MLREIRALGYDGGYTAVTDFLRSVRPPATAPFEVRVDVLRHGYETSGCGGHAAWSKGGCWSALIWAGVR